LALVRRLGFDFVSLAEARRRLIEGGPRFAAMTFDDGYRDTRDFALPILEKHGAPATVFFATGFLDRTARLWWLELEEALRRLDAATVAIDGRALTVAARTPAEKAAAFERLYWALRARPEEELIAATGALAEQAGVSGAAIADALFMDWDEAAAFAAHPLIAAGAHSRAHRMLAKGAEAEARAEMAGSKTELEGRFGCAVDAFARSYFFDAGPLFPLQTSMVTPICLFSCLAAGIACGALAWVLSASLYKVEDVFAKLPIHWMWWPAVGAIVIGVGGYLQPRALGVGYDVIGDLLHNHLAIGAAVALLLCKGVMWVVALGSGTSGGVLAPLLMLGAGLGVILGPYLPGGEPNLWPLVFMAATLGGMMRAPIMALMFAFEVTHDANALLPLLTACATAYGFTVLLMPRSILTEKLSRRGIHLTREYGTDPLETVSLVEVMAELGWQNCGEAAPGVPLPEVYAYSDETSRAAAEKMAIAGIDTLPVVDRSSNAVCGRVTLLDLLLGRRKLAKREQERLRIFAPGH